MNSYWLIRPASGLVHRPKHSLHLKTNHLITGLHSNQSPPNHEPLDRPIQPPFPFVFRRNENKGLLSSQEYGVAPTNLRAERVSHRRR